MNLQRLREAAAKVCFSLSVASFVVFIILGLSNLLSAALPAYPVDLLDPFWMYAAFLGTLMFGVTAETIRPDERGDAA